ncbi:hypothetical protein EDF57_101899 [Novosphingobium sp. PhB55]|uniref:hypothetical protein n=1 Tax=Novosphingobium sp. PhB55 TaxID=2485106 RepID=UPI001066E6D7|nr:hypothetical protein [Novosphingobium sp. PhB55]TDW69005.1 hypothetical protein EDF57_101899 [Novosphingobium sp. PhB55]
MGVRIEALEGNRLQLCGDIDTVLDVPARGITEGFSLAFSDGTLVGANWIPGGPACQFAIAAEGAAMVKIVRQGFGEALELDWNFDWITLACGTETLQPYALPDGEDVLQLTLDIEVKEVA